MQPTDRDETLSWQAATTIMGLATLVTVATRVLGMDPFTDVFDVFIVYVPTAILIGRTLLESLRESSANDSYAMSDQSVGQNMVA